MRYGFLDDDSVIRQCYEYSSEDELVILVEVYLCNGDLVYEVNGYEDNIDGDENCWKDDVVM